MAMEIDELEPEAPDRVNERKGKVLARELADDEELALDQLIDAFGAPPRESRAGSPGREKLRRHEFVCASCRLIHHRSMLADPDRGLCADCAPRDGPSGPAI